MALYLIGDVQGCDSALERLLDTLAFSPSRDHLVFLGDLVNRGPDSLAVLRRIKNLNGAAQSILGNHDLHLLGVAQGVRPPGRRDTLSSILTAPDRPALLDWLRQQALALHRSIAGRDLLMVHAGVLPQWDVATTLSCANEVHDILRGPALTEFLHQMYGNRPDRWDPHLHGPDRLRLIINALTRMRLCTADGTLEFDSKEGLEDIPPGYMPWFDVPSRRTKTATVACGHWSTLGYVSRPDLIATDTGCVWGGCLSAVRIGSTLDEREHIQVHCDQAQQPG